MKTLCLLLIGLTSFQSPGGSGFYGISFNNINGTVVNTDSYRGKKTVIFLIRAASPSVPMLKYADSVQRARTDIQVLAAPTSELGGGANDSTLIEIQKKTAIVITHPLKVKKSNGATQHALFAWLTSLAKNKHFDTDADEEGKIFIISPKGTLYSVLGGGAPKAAVAKAINKDFKD